MKIATQIRFLSLLLLLASIAFGYSFWKTAKNLENRRNVNEVSQKIIKAAFELNIITNEYIKARTNRVIMQRRSRNTSLNELLNEAGKILIDIENKHSLDKITKNEEKLGVLFHQLEALYARNEVIISKTMKRKHAQLISQIQIQVQGMLSEASRMSTRSLNSLKASEERLEFTTALLLFVLWSVFIITFVLIDRRVIRPISNLQISAEQLSSGNYDTRIEVKGKNEVSALADSYNKLASDIQKKISSLTQKSIRLNESQQNLLNLNENLQRMVSYQTSDLRDSETRQRAILESMHDGVITLGEDFHIVNINPAVEDMFGYTEEELLGKSMGFLVTKLPGEKNFSNDYLEGLGKNKTKGDFPVEMSLNEMEIDGESMYTAIVRDNTERKRADKLKTEFVSTVSHELRTPLTAIRGSLGLVNAGVLGNIPEKASELLLTANRNADRLLNLINDLLDIQKIEAGKMEYQYTNVDLMALLENSVLDNASYAEQFKVGIELGEKVENVAVYADAHRLSQIIANLLSNAAKFSHRDSKIYIHISIEGELAKISIADQGDGMPEEYHSKVFAKFSQSDSSDTRKIGGTGLGLAISKQMIESMDGKIDFTSVLGEGTTFNIYIPIASE